MSRDGDEHPRDPPQMRLFVCKKNREGKSNLKMKGGGERNQIIARIYTPALWALQGGGVNTPGPLQNWY